jgi:tetratricopeptide (TPR) repeat protein
MKTARRQQLRTNELAQSLADLLEYLRRNSGAVLAVVAGAVLVVGLGVYWYAARVSAYEQGWDDFYASQLAGERSSDARLAEMKAVAGKYKDPALVATAWAKVGDACIQEAMSGTRSVEEQQRLLGEAANAYMTVVNHYPDQLLDVADARFGLAFLAENLQRFDEARNHYQKILDDARFANMPYKAQAEEAIKRLQEISQPVVFAPSPPATAPATEVIKLPTTGPAARPSTRPAVVLPPAGLPSRAADKARTAIPPPGTRPVVPAKK